MIDTSTLKTLTEVRIVDFLETKATRPMRLHEIVEALNANRKNCSKTLKSLAKENFICEFEEFGHTFYASGHRYLHIFLGYVPPTSTLPILTVGLCHPLHN